MTDCWIALGGNVGDVADTFERALAAIDQSPSMSVVARSRNYSTSPVGTNAGDRFINAVAQLTARCGPLEVLDRLQSVETQLGRVRLTRWGPRTLDLDLLFYGQQILSTERLTLPHPHLWYRRFVLDPLTELAAELVHPTLGLRVSHLRQLLLVRPLACVLLGADETAKSQLRLETSAAFPEVLWQDHPDNSTCLIFDLGTTVPVHATMAGGQHPSNRLISLDRFPTLPRESLRDVLTAALCPAEPIDSAS